MRKTTLILVILLLLSFPVQSAPSDAQEFEPFSLDMVCPTGSEGFTIKNVTPFPQDLGGYSVTDGEGTLRFLPGTIVPNGGKYTVLSSDAEPWMQICDYVTYDSGSVVKEGKFNLADAGDDLYLMDPSGVITDSFVYGDVEGYVHWQGEPYHKVPKKTVAYRNAAANMPFDGEQWKDHVPGRTLYHFSRTYEDCSVTPIVFPDSQGEPILRELQEAEETVTISMYTFDSERVASALMMLLENGVDVRMFLEGSPAGGTADREISVLKNLSSHGADIRFIKSTDGYKRFDYVHAKYAVVDGDTSIITSENWTDYAFGNNRGWGAVVRNGGCAEYLSTIIERDRNGMDVLTFDQMYPTAVPSLIPRYVPVYDDFPEFTADVSTAMSPDYSRETLMSFIDSSQERFYSQQLNVDYDWLTGTDNPLTLMEEKTEKGVDVRLQVDVTYDSPHDNDIRDGYGIYSYYTYKDTLDVRYTDGSKLFHNKGMISDDRTWIGSMNWTDGSIDRNREMCVIIDSREFTDMFAGLFLQDWGPVYNGSPELNVEISGGGYRKAAVLDATSSSLPFGSEIKWDLDGDGMFETKGARIEWRFYEDSQCSVSAMTPDGQELRKEFSVHVDKETGRPDMVNGNVNSPEEGSGFLEGPLKYLPLLILIATIIALKRIAGRR